MARLNLGTDLNVCVWTASPRASCMNAMALSHRSAISSVTPDREMGITPKMPSSSGMTSTWKPWFWSNMPLGSTCRRQAQPRDNGRPPVPATTRLSPKWLNTRITNDGPHEHEALRSPLIASGFPVDTLKRMTCGCHRLDQSTEQETGPSNTNVGKRIMGKGAKLCTKHRRERGSEATRYHRTTSTMMLGPKQPFGKTGEARLDRSRSNRESRANEA